MMLLDSKNKTLWLENLTFGGILFLVLSNGIAGYEIFFDGHRATPRALRFAAILAKILPLQFHPVSLCLNQKDEKGLALEYSRADNHCAVVDRFCEKQLRDASAWLKNMTKCFISSQLMDRITFITLVLHYIKGQESGKHLIYLPGHYLNFLLHDFFKPQIMVKSVPSLTAFLRLAVAPLALIGRSGLKQIFQTGVRGNIQENPETPAVWIELEQKSGVWNQLRDFIATNSADRAYEIVYYLDRPDTPATPERTGELEGQGFGWIDTHNMLHARLGAADYFKLMAGFLTSVTQRPFWLGLFLWRFEIMRALYLSLYKRFKVRLLFQHQETSWLQEAQKQAIESAGGVMAGLHWSNFLNTQYPDLLNCQHVMLVWGDAHREFLEVKGHTCSHIIPCGLWVAESGAKREDIDPPGKGDFTIAIFDSSASYSLYQSPENLSKFYLEILGILENNSLLSGILKTKSSQVSDLRHLPAGEEIVHRVKSLEKAGRLRVLDWMRHSPVDAAKAADLSVCFGFNSAGIIAGLLGLRAIHWDCTGWLKYPIYQDEDQKLLFATLPEMKRALMQAAGGDENIGKFDRWRKCINYFDDCAGRERILRFLSLYMQEEASIEGIDSTVKQYLSEEVGSSEFYKNGRCWWTA